MTDTFAIPRNFPELLNELVDNYCVKNLVVPNEIPSKLEEARLALREEGPTYILSHFDTYYSVLHHEKKIGPSVVFTAYQELQRATDSVLNLTTSLLADKDNLDEETQKKMINVLMMLLYIYLEFVSEMETRKRKQLAEVLVKEKGTKQNKEMFGVDKSKVIAQLNILVQQEIELFWDPPIVEQSLVTSMVGVGYCFLENIAIKQDKALQSDIFGLMGNLIKRFDYAHSFVVRLFQGIRLHEHLVLIGAEGVKHISDIFEQQRMLVHYFVNEITEWIMEQPQAEAHSIRYSTNFLGELAKLMPQRFTGEIEYLEDLLGLESVPLRCAILGIFTEVIERVLTGHESSESDIEMRDSLLAELLSHLRDLSTVVRAKVINCLGRLQQNNAIPLGKDLEVFRKVREHLRDKGPTVRKATIACVTIFLEHNPFGAVLKKEKFEEDLETKSALLKDMESTFSAMRVKKLNERQAQWAKIENDVKEAIAEYSEKQMNSSKSRRSKVLDSDDDDEGTQNEEQVLSKTEKLAETMRQHLRNGKYHEAIKICEKIKKVFKDWRNLADLNVADTEKDKVLLTLIQMIFLDMGSINVEAMADSGYSEDDIQKITVMKEVISYLTNAVEFTKQLAETMEPMKEFLFSTAINDMHEAIHFFVTAFRFQITGSEDAILEMLRLMQYEEPDRSDAVIKALKTIYLTTEGKNMQEHTTIILNRLINLLKGVTFDHIDNIEKMVSEWTAKGILDNSVLNLCWQYYTQRSEVSDEDSRASAILLRMAAIGRSTLITKNIKVVASMTTSELGKRDMLFFAESCRLMSLMGRDKIDINSKEAPTKIQLSDPIFDEITAVLVDNVTEPIEHYSTALQAGFQFIFRMCASPLTVSDAIATQIYEKVQNGTRTTFVIIRFCELLGIMAYEVLRYLDETVYKELKRRANVRESLKQGISTINTNNSASASCRNKNRRSASISMRESADETMIDGAQAEDSDAEFILNLLENDIVTGSGSLSKFSDLLQEICTRRDIYKDPKLQYSAICALMRCMLISSRFCNNNVKLLFSILEKTNDEEIKCVILIHCSDLLTRFPNVVEPWSPKIYRKLQDDSDTVRKTAFYILSNLILRDMIRAHGHIAEMAACIIDKNKEISEMCRNFFTKLSKKENNLVNVVPDIFTHLVNLDSVTEEELRVIMKFLFDFIDNHKRIENLVDRFCCKYSVEENHRLNRNITYCLSLVTYNNKSLMKLHEKFPMYKQHVHDAEIYAGFKQILTEANTIAELKTLAGEIENCIASVFELNENGEAPPMVPKIAKPTKGRPKKGKKVVRRSSDEEDEFVAPKKPAPKSRGRKRIVESDSDSD